MERYAGGMSPAPYRATGQLARTSTACARSPYNSASWIGRNRSRRRRSLEGSFGLRDSVALTKFGLGPECRSKIATKFGNPMRLFSPAPSCLRRRYLCTRRLGGLDCPAHVYQGRVASRPREDTLVQLRRARGLTSHRMIASNKTRCKTCFGLLFGFSSPLSPGFLPHRRRRSRDEFAM